MKEVLPGSSQSDGAALSDLFRLIDKHDRDIVLDPVSETATVTDEGTAPVLQLYLSLALGACQDIQ